MNYLSNFVFKIETIPDIEIIQKQDIIRNGIGNTEKNPITFNVKGNHSIDDVSESINILVFSTDN